jgi:hypothetical protein
MRGRRLVEGAVAGLWLGATVVGPSACNRAPAAAEDVSSSTGPPIQICYEPDGAPCPPLDGGDDADDVDETGVSSDAPAKEGAE